MSLPSDRHLSLASFVSYVRAAVPIEHPIPGTPRLLLFIDPDGDRLGLLGPAMSGTPVHSGLEHLTVRTVHHGQRRMTEIAVTDPALFIDGYLLLCGIADRVQLDRQPITAALAETVRRLGHLLIPENRLPRDVEIGLLGELCMLLGTVAVHGPGTGLDAWRGARAEEHDFGLADIDIEVKTTSSERRAHWISALTQLLPTGARALWLVSFQITEAGTGGRTIGDLITRVRERFPGDTDQDRLEKSLYTAGWRDRYSDTSRQRWRLRTPPAAYIVDDGFPRLTPAQLTAAGVDNARITDIRYRIDLTGRPADPAPAALAQAVTTGQLELT
jgi:hypothetical protein